MFATPTFPERPIKQIESLLYHIALDCDACLTQFDGEPLNVFAERLIEEIAERSNCLHEIIQEILSHDLNGDEVVA